MPSADALQLYHPMTLQSMPNSPSNHHHSSDYGGGSSRHMLAPSRSSHHLSGGLEYSQSRPIGGGLYAPGQGTHSSSHTPSSYMSSDVPLSGPPPLPYSSHNNPHSSSQQNIYPSLLPSPRSTAPQQYFNEGHSHSGSGSGSNYGTPQ